MDRLGSFISRRRKFVLGTWIVLLVVSLPFFAMQTKHLTAGGFEVPGSQSEFVANSITASATRHGFTARDMTLEVTGTCAECQKEA